MSVRVSGSPSGSTGVDVFASSLVLDRVTVAISGATEIRAVYSINVATNLVITNSSLTTTGGTSSYAVYNAAGPSVKILNTKIRSSGASINSCGVYNYGDGTVALTNAQVSAEGSPPGGAMAVCNARNASLMTGGTIRIDASQLVAPTSTLVTEAPATTYVGTTRLDGGKPFLWGAGIQKCIHSYNGNYDAVNVDCLW